MMRFFISRPIFSSVISIIIMIAGLVASQVLPVAQYPQISPPTLMITASYPGASPETLARTVAAPIEEQLNGVEGLSYFTSSAASNGTITITATFAVGTDPDIAAMNVNNRVKIAEPRLPAEVRTNGVIVAKRSTDMLLVIALEAQKAEHDTLFLSNYASINIVDDLKRIEGVGDANIFGAQDYSMRIWLRPDVMARYGVTTSDVAAAIRSQNAQNVAGKIGQAPAPKDQLLVYTVNAKGRLVTEEEFGNIIVKAGGPAGMLRVKDIARIELGAYSYNESVFLDGKSTIAMGIYLQTGANALATAERVKKKIDELQKSFPEGISYVIPYDTTLFVKASVSAVKSAILEAALLVVAVVFIFLQSWRATLIPIVAVPVSLIGTFAGLYLFGFSINILTLLAMVLSIGIVVDDAIVVLENVERLIREEKMRPFHAAVEAMDEVSGAVIAIVFVLVSVFIPVAFLGGLAGALYKQFAITVAISVTISGIVALTLTPALCALLLKAHEGESKFFAPFNRAFAAFTNFYTSIVNLTLHHRIIGAFVFISVILLGAHMLRTTPTSFVPEEDQGYLLSAIMLPDNATLARTGETGERFRQLISQNPAVQHVFVINGFDLVGGGNKTNAGTIFIPLKNWSERKDAPVSKLSKQFFQAGMMLPDGMAFVFNPPAIQGLGVSGGFELYIQSRQDSDPTKLSQVTNEFVQTLSANKDLTGIRTFFRPNVPQIFVEVDEPKALSMGINLSDLYATLQSTMGSLYVNDFNKGGKVYRVQLQAEAAYRMKPEDIGKVYVRNQAGDMIPISAVSTVKSVVGAEQIERFNGFIAAEVLGSGAPGISSGAAMDLVEKIAKETLPEGYTVAWTGQAFQEKASSGTAAQAFIFALIMVFLILAAQYERWSLPLAILMAVPFALAGALSAIAIRHMPNDIYFQIGLVVLIGLAAKNAILIVEFAAQKHAEGLSVKEAALEGARLRFRPIVMTSLAFILGVVPLAIATGAGAAARRSMGTGVAGGMLAATFIATIFIPMFYTWLTREHKPTSETASKETH